MSDALAAILVALIGALVGSVGAVLVQHRLRVHAGERERQLALSRQDLYRLQDAMESVRRRLLNLLERGGRGAMSEHYRQLTTLYAFGVVLAVERRFERDGVYFELNAYWEGLGDFLRTKRFDGAVRGLRIHHYHRMALADLAAERGSTHERTRSLLEFLAAYEQLAPATRDEFVLPFLAGVEAGDRSQWQAIVDHCGDVIDRLSEVTGLQPPSPWD